MKMSLTELEEGGRLYLREHLIDSKNCQLKVRVLKANRWSASKKALILQIKWNVAKVWKLNFNLQKRLAEGKKGDTNELMEQIYEVGFVNLVDVESDFEIHM